MLCSPNLNVAAIASMFRDICLPGRVPGEMTMKWRTIRLLIAAPLVLGYAGCAQLPVEQAVGLHYCSLISHEPCLDQSLRQNCPPC